MHLCHLIIIYCSCELSSELMITRRLFVAITELLPTPKLTVQLLKFIMG